MVDALVSWSGGKDAATALAAARASGVRVTGLLSTVAERADGTGVEVPVHGVPLAVLAAQADALGVDLHPVVLPRGCPDPVYRERLGTALPGARDAGVTALVHGDVALADVRAFRESVLEGTGVAGLFPLWGADTAALARRIVDGGLRARVAAVDPARVPAALAGRPFDDALLAALPAGTDPCGENGEFHTVVTDGPGFARPVPLAVTGTVTRDGHVQAVYG
ncbi:ATP-binding protein [Pseudonocardia nantongensis]|uniref:Dph6-related ATP pyrophosphatase n=1 Tax=Pseudonocardia nantongensis TaxID=1181885 RepID=UPI00397D2FDF